MMEERWLFRMDMDSGIELEEWKVIRDWRRGLPCGAYCVGGLILAPYVSTRGGGGNTNYQYLCFHCYLQQWREQKS